ncbi:MAG: DNA repair protein RecO [Clostridia bacterium]|nr:DNA repair protein RecO [Clostridia bacterium]
MEHTLDALVLGAADYKDDDKLLTLFTAERGVLRARIRGVKKPKAKLGFAAQPFTFAEFVLVEKGEYYTVKSAYLYDGFYNLRSDVVKFYAGSVVLAVAKETVPENEEFRPLFIAAVQALKELCYTDADPLETLIGYLLLAAGESGYSIDLSGCGSCGGEIKEAPHFDFGTGCFTCSECGGGSRASESTYHVLRKCSGLTYDEGKTQGGKKRALRLMKVFLGEKTETEFPALGELLQLCGDE